MHDIEVYDLGVWVDYNPKNTPYRGSCIFLHRWTFPLETTSGCTAFSAPHLQKLVSWLKDDHHPLLVQMPIDLYQKVSTSFGFPAISRQMINR